MVAARIGAAILGASFLCAAFPCAAQINVLTPLFRDLNGGAVWGSMGSEARSQSGSKDTRPIWRVGFAAFYGPFGGGGDTTVVQTFAVVDSTDSMITLPGGSTIHRRTRSTTDLRSESKRLGRSGKITLAVGYQHSPFYRLPGTPLGPTVALGGPYVGAFLGPYVAPLAPRRLTWYAGLGSTIVQLKDMAGRVDTLAVKLTTERTIAPEFYLMLGYIVSPNYRVLVAGTYQYLRFGSVAYQTVEAGRQIPGDVLARLPSAIQLESWHFTLGVSFAASSLIPSH